MKTHFENIELTGGDAAHIKTMSQEANSSKSALRHSGQHSQVKEASHPEPVYQNGHNMPLMDPAPVDPAPDLPLPHVPRTSGSTKAPSLRGSLIQEVYETVTELTNEPIHKDELDVTAFFKVLKDHRTQSKLVYVMTVTSIVVMTHFALSRQWLLPLYYTVVTPVLLLHRLISYWKLKYQYFLLDFCYFANIYWYIFIWFLPSREDVFAVAFAVANGPLIWALFVFRNSLVFHSLDKVTSLYIHVLPGLLSFVVRWYPDETAYSSIEYPHCKFGFSPLWLIGVPFLFIFTHQILYILVVNVILRPSDDYLNVYRYLMSKETSALYRLCHIFGDRFTFWMYQFWSHLVSLIMLACNLVWYNYFAAHCALLVTFITVAVYNGATYYVDVFQLQRPKPTVHDAADLDKSKSNSAEHVVVFTPVHKRSLGESV